MRHFPLARGNFWANNPAKDRRRRDYTVSPAVGASCRVVSLDPPARLAVSCRLSPDQALHNEPTLGVPSDNNIAGPEVSGTAYEHPLPRGEHRNHAQPFNGGAEPWQTHVHILPGVAGNALPD